MSKAQFVKLMFDDISSKYDLLNDVLSFGMHRIWKKNFVTNVMKSSPQKLLDCATGTGDLVFMAEKFSNVEVTGIDFSEKMIEQAQKRADHNGSLSRFMTADILNLPYANKSFDATMVSFGVRNVEDLEKGLKELSRVSKSLFILEFGQPKNRFLKLAYFNLLKLYVPIFGIISGRKDAYEYLITSSEQFPSDDKFLQILRKNSDFKNFVSQPIFGGIAYTYTANGV